MAEIPVDPRPPVDEEGGSSLLDFLKGLFMGGDEEKQAFVDDPRGTLTDAGFGDITGADVREALSLASDSFPPDVASQIAPILTRPVPVDPAADDLEGAVQQITYVTNNITINETNTTNIDLGGDPGAQSMLGILPDSALGIGLDDLGPLAGVAAGVAGAAGAAAGGVLGAATEAGEDVIGGVVGGAGEVVGGVLGAAGTVVGGVFSEGVEAGGEIAGGLGNVFEGDIFEGAGDIAGAGIGLAGGLVDTGFDAAGEVADAGFDAAGSVIGGGVGAVFGDDIGGAVEGGFDVAGDVVGGVADTAGDVVETVADTAGDVVEGVADTAEDVVDFFNPF